MKCDVFISHASEDKEKVGRPLADLLAASGVNVWLDENELKLGDSLRAKIDQGLAASRFGVVILSPAFFAKDWPQRELNGLAAKESAEHTVILPVWHGVSQQDVAKHSPMLADKRAANTEQGLGAVASEILDKVIPMRAKEKGVPLNQYFPEDRDLLTDLLELFNRPAFRGPFLLQTDPCPAQRAMKITLKAINTGRVESNQGDVTREIVPITRIRDAKLFATMQQVETRLKKAINLVEILKKKAPAQRKDICRAVDDERDSIIATLNKVWVCFGLHTLPEPTSVTDSTDVWEQFA